MPSIPITRDGTIVGAIEIDLSRQADVLDTSGDLMRGGRLDDLSDRLAEAGEAIGATCETIIANMTTALGKAIPETLEIHFGVTFAGEAGIPLVTKGSAEATIEVTATWSKNSLNS